MKRFWLVLLSLGLIVAFSTTSFAQVDVKFSGEFVAGGMYLDKTTLTKTPTLSYAGANPYTTTVAPTMFQTGPSTAFYFQRLRLKIKNYPG